MKKVFKNAKRRVSDKSYQTRTPKADVQLNHIEHAMHRFSEDTDHYDPNETRTTADICDSFDSTMCGSVFGVPYHMARRYYVVNVKTDDLVSCEQDLVGFGSDDSALVFPADKYDEELSAILKSGHRYAYQVAYPTDSHNGLMSDYKPMDDKTVAIIAENMLNCINDLVFMNE